MKVKCILSLVLGFNVFVVYAQIPTGYYNSANGLTGTALETALHNKIKNHTVISYANLWTAFNTTDKKSNGMIWDIYSDIPGGTPPYEFTYSTDQCGNYTAEAGCYNREHSWPKSWFSDLSPPISDLFHIYPTDGYVNNKRDNYAYGLVSNPTWTSLNGGKLGPNTASGFSGTVFEPIDAYKGDLARGYFYMVVRYLTEDSGWTTSDATNKAVLLPWQVCLMLDWHHQDTVSAKEINRNNAVYNLQHNRNPFIDHPEWADSIFNCVLTKVTDQRAVDFKMLVSPNPANDNVSVSFSKNISNAEIKLYNCLGEIVLLEKINGNLVNLSVGQLAKGVYILRFVDGKNVGVERVVVE